VAVFIPLLLTDEGCSCTVPAMFVRCYNTLSTVLKSVNEVTLQQVSTLFADPSGRAVYGVGMRPLAGWDFGFDSRRGHGGLFVVSVVCYQVEVSVSG
jgi:hypothetical protein